MDEMCIDLFCCEMKVISCVRFDHRIYTFFIRKYSEKKTQLYLVHHMYCAHCISHMWVIIDIVRRTVAELSTAGAPQAKIPNYRLGALLTLPRFRQYFVRFYTTTTCMRIYCRPTV